MKKLLLITLIAVALFYVAPPAIAHAQGIGKDWTANCIKDNVPSLRCIPSVFGNLIAGTLAFAGVVAAFLIVYAGIRFVTSGGDPKQVAGARQILTYAIIGLVIILCSFAILYFIAYTTGAKCITTLGFNCQ